MTATEAASLLAECGAEMRKPSRLPFHPSQLSGVVRTMTEGYAIRLNENQWQVVAELPADYLGIYYKAGRPYSPLVVFSEADQAMNRSIMADQAKYGGDY